MQIVFQNDYLKCQKTLKMWHATSTSTPFDFDGLPYPWVRWYPQFCFIDMTSKKIPICPSSLSFAINDTANCKYILKFVDIKFNNYPLLDMLEKNIV